MGLTLTAGHPGAITDEERAASFLGRLQGALGESVAVGRPGELFASDDHFMGEMGWPWWQELQQRAVRELGADAAPHLLAVDAWCGVYVDARTPPLRLRDESAEPALEASDHDAAPSRPPLARRLLSIFSREQRVNRAMRSVMMQMVDQFGPSPEDRDALQVGDLRALHAELTQLAQALGYEASEAALTELARSYDTDDRIDDDGDVQCLCHAWVTSARARWGRRCGLSNSSGRTSPPGDRILRRA